jgi:ABC-type phosphate/phosphonate transport system permease subunit
MLVRLIGAATLIIAVLELGLYWAECFAPRHHVPLRFLPVLLRSIPAVVGLVILIRARAIANWLAERMDL